MSWVRLVVRKSRSVPVTPTPRHLACIDLPTLMRTLSWIFRCKPVPLLALSSEFDRVYHV
jgi:hypothetical protein